MPETFLPRLDRLRYRQASEALAEPHFTLEAALRVLADRAVAEHAMIYIHYVPADESAPVLSFSSQIPPHHEFLDRAVDAALNQLYADEAADAPSEPTESATDSPGEF